MEGHSIGKVIAALRKTKGWTQVELAEKLQVSDKAISKWESGTGYPEISQFPAMANLFGVSIDYLMTGKEPEKEVLTISKSELCARNDDISLAEEVKDLSNDENEKNIVDYILQYQSLNVFKKLCKIDDSFIYRFSLLDAITLAVLSNSLCVLKGKKFGLGTYAYRFTFDNEDEIKNLLPAEDESYYTKYEDKIVCVLPRSFFTMLVTDERINSETLNVFLTNQNGRNCVWYHAFPYLIDEAYKNGNKDMLRRLIDLSKENNAIAYETIKPEYIWEDRGYNCVMNYFFVVSKYGKQKHGLVRILESTIKQSLDDGDFDLTDEFNKINSNILTSYKPILDGLTNCYIASDDEIRVAKLKLDKTVSENELRIQSALHNGIISIAEIKSVTDLVAVKKALDDYPIHIVEELNSWYRNKNTDKLFRFAIDHNYDTLAQAVLEDNPERIEMAILGSWNIGKNDSNNKALFDVMDINKNELYTDEKYKRNIIRNQKSLSEAIDYLQRVRERLIGELTAEFDKKNIVSELTEEYFNEELKQGNFETVVIKLCVRLEAVLKCDFGYVGSFAEMLDRYCDEKLTWEEDDGWGYTVTKSDEKTIVLLNKLRKVRNSLVHSQKTTETLNEKELKKCIEYVCSL